MQYLFYIAFLWAHLWRRTVWGCITGGSDCCWLVGGDAAVNQFGWGTMTSEWCQSNYLLVIVVVDQGLLLWLLQAINNVGWTWASLQWGWGNVGPYCCLCKDCGKIKDKINDKTFCLSSMWHIYNHVSSQTIDKCLMSMYLYEREWGGCFSKEQDLSLWGKAC